MQSIFEPMVRVPTSGVEMHEQSKTSLGLGLFIVHEIVTRHGGSVAVQSSEKAGTAFTIRLPRADGTPMKERLKTHPRRRFTDRTRSARCSRHDRRMACLVSMATRTFALEQYASRMAAMIFGSPPIFQQCRGPGQHPGDACLSSSPCRARISAKRCSPRQNGRKPPASSPRSLRLTRFPSPGPEEPLGESRRSVGANMAWSDTVLQRGPTLTGGSGSGCKGATDSGK
ncbi:MAG: HAMP domain-containing histidine kinase [Methylibium sp.]|nr:HAMP domain-containing histidine kinase [Methylibium sp.]